MLPMPQKSTRYIARAQRNDMKKRDRIVLVQNDQYLIDTRKALLERHGYTVQAVHTVESARAICQSLHCDLVIVDSEEDYNAAIKLCEEIKAEDPEVNVAVITWHAAEISTPNVPMK